MLEHVGPGIPPHTTASPPRLRCLPLRNVSRSCARERVESGGTRARPSRASTRHYCVTAAATLLAFGCLKPCLGRGKNLVENHHRKLTPLSRS